ncbi:hypothetical protein N836_27585 [Leptolyngbya sp. Heron Island J]|uniref:DUF790 family protein n=1 Tax=Leptolyngbya sp. Heron Island J TaxID=1385935 RepID=UPI0003B99FED|nr:DUF790 family protein [Leptolyngbya sp. Heron Island J]ESA32356.1 hypothetical protein N836_27585 [Leptolyngbya sp. Heron Island J]
MLPSDLLIHRPRGDSIDAKQLPLTEAWIAIATSLIALFQATVGDTQGNLNQKLQAIEGDNTDYRIKRGLAHILRSSFSTFEIISPLDPQTLRQRVFSLASASAPSPVAAQQNLQTLANQLTQELDKDVEPTHIQQGLYADLKENRILTQFDAPTPEALIHRYNLSQVQGIFYRASHVVLNLHRNDPGEYKLMFRYLKLFRLMTYIEGEADQGFTITIDGPASLFKASTRYGLDIAKLVPAILHVTRWHLSATLQWKDTYTKKLSEKSYTLDSECSLVSHYPPGKPYDSMIEAAFAERWASLVEKSKTQWQLEREVELIPIPGSVMIPDFRLVHPDGRVYLLEIVGYWRPDYLRKKFAQVQKSDCSNLILAISERLNLAKSGIDVKKVPAKIVWFKDKLQTKPVLNLLESL